MSSAMSSAVIPRLRCIRDGTRRARKPLQNQGFSFVLPSKRHLQRSLFSVECRFWRMSLFQATALCLWETFHVCFSTRIKTRQAEQRVGSLQRSLYIVYALLVRSAMAHHL